MSGWSLARWREIVSRPPENIRSTATAEPVNSDLSRVNHNIAQKTLTGNA